MKNNEDSRHWNITSVQTGENEVLLEYNKRWYFKKNDDKSQAKFAYKIILELWDALDGEEKAQVLSIKNIKEFEVNEDTSNV